MHIFYSPYLPLRWLYVVPFWLCCWFSQIHAEEANKLDAALVDIIHQQHYQHPARIRLQKLSLPNLNTYLKQLDPYSRYFSPKEYLQLRSKAQQRIYLGLGINVIGENYPRIVVPYQQGPSAEAGLQMPAYLRSLQGQAITSDAAIETAMPKLSMGKLVDIGVSNTSTANSVKHYPVVARAFSIPSIERVAEGKNYQIVRIHKFRSNETATQLQILLEQYPDKRLIIDLRFCVGGSLYEAIDAMSLFVPKSTPLVRLQTNDGEKESFDSLREAIPSKKPIYILVSPYTASSAEIFSMVLKEYRRAVLIGQLTRGKCLSQRLSELEKGAAVRLSVYEITTTAGWSCQGKGIKPNIWLPSVSLVDTPRIMQDGAELLENGGHFVCFSPIHTSIAQAERQLFELQISINLDETQKLALLTMQNAQDNKGWRACVETRQGEQAANALQQHLNSTFEDKTFVLVKLKKATELSL